MISQYIVSYTYGEDAYRKVPEVCLPYGKKAVVVGGEKALAAARPYFDEAIRESGLKITDYIWYGGEATFENAQRIVELPAWKEADMVFAIGGGKAIDTTKYAAKILDNKPFFTFPTIAATCAAASAEAIMYYPNHEVRGTYVASTAIHVFINTRVIAEAPELYLWAGIGDTMAKHFETSLAIRGREDEITLGQELGVHIGEMSFRPLLKYGVKALEDCRANTLSTALEKIALTNIITTGIVSCHVGVTINANMAHAICYGLTVLPQVKSRHLHGEIVSYGTLVLMLVDGQLETLESVFPVYQQMHLPTKLADLETSLEEMDPVIETALAVDDMKYTPYEVTPDMLIKAMRELEEYNKTHA